MLVKKLILLFLFPAFAYSQPATFYADTLRLMEYNQNDTSSEGYGMQMQWIIKGQQLSWGSTPIEVGLTESGVDTIFFKWHDHSKWDTLLCKIKGGSSVTFVYSPCCDYFDVVDSNGDRFKGKVSFDLKGSLPKKTKYLGSIDDSRVFMTQKPDTIPPFYRSVMLPNTYNVEVEQIKDCSGKHCQEAAIQKPDGSMEISYHFRIVEEILNFHYLPVSEEPVSVTYDLDSGVVRIE